jgi:hypothetical protein
MDTIAELNITVDAYDIEKDIFTILAEIRPLWKQPEVELKVGLQCENK